jgi:hypothetical protein
MTTIAWDGETLAADTQGSNGVGKFNISKVFRLSSGAIVGGSGTCYLIHKFIAWLDEGGKGDPPKPQDDDDEVYLLMVKPDRIVWLCEEGGPYPINETKFAVGSGATFARAFMHLGKTAEEAVALTSLFDKGTGPRVETMKLEPVVKRIRKRG